MPGDLPPDDFRRAMHRVADLAADYLQQVAEYPVLPAVAPGDVSHDLPASPPAEGEPLEQILDDYKRLIEPHMTHWNHPGFLAYFGITGSGPGILGETLAAALNVNAMLWRTSPAATELEERVCDWVRQMVGLPEAFRGHINDTASVSTLLALAAARQRLQEYDIRQHGAAGRPELPALVIYTSEQAHSSVDKAAILLGLGLDNVRRVAVDAQFRLDPRALEEAMRKDADAGRRGIAVVATAGTTSTTSVDPLPAVAELCRDHDLWLHVDAAYAGSAAICPELRRRLAGWEAADSVVINPHKWLFTPIDCSLLLVRDLAHLRRTFSLVPEYLKSDEEEVTNLMDLGVQLGRRFRALKLWFVIRAFGVEGLQQRIRAHCAWALELAEWIRREPDFELAAPVPWSTVCFRAVTGGAPEAEDAFNERLLAEVNAAGPFLLSHTRLRGRYVLRVAIGNLRTTRRHIEELWELVRSAAERLC